MRKLLLHTCCAICASGTITQLKNQFALACYYYNPNIHPAEEYQKKRDESRRYCDKIRVAFIEAPYEPAKWFKAVKGLENEPESGARCGVCIGMRLEQTARSAKEHGFDIFSATITLLLRLYIQPTRSYFVKYRSALLKNHHCFFKVICLANDCPP